MKIETTIDTDISIDRKNKSAMYFDFTLSMCAIHSCFSVAVAA